MKITFGPDKVIFGLQIGKVGVDYPVKSIDMRYLKLSLIVNYEDSDGQLGSAIREIELAADVNLAKYKPVTANSVWDYGLARMMDGGVP